jgi:hypothetical protein
VNDWALFAFVLLNCDLNKSPKAKVNVCFAIVFKNV